MNAIRPLALALTLACAAALPVSNAQAGLVHAGFGSGVCKASNGANTNLFFGLYNVKNVSNTTQYVTCNTEFIRDRLVNLLPGAGYKLSMIVGSTSAVPQTVTCIASVGQGGGIASQSTKVVTTVAGAPGRLDFFPVELKAYSDTSSLSVYCGLKPATNIGLFLAQQPEVNVLVP